MTPIEQAIRKILPIEKWKQRASIQSSMTNAAICEANVKEYESLLPALTALVERAQLEARNQREIEVAYGILCTAEGYSIHVDLKPDAGYYNVLMAFCNQLKERTHAEAINAAAALADTPRSKHPISALIGGYIAAEKEAELRALGPCGKHPKACYRETISRVDGLCETYVCTICEETRALREECAKLREAQRRARRTLLAVAEILLAAKPPEPTAAP